MHFNFLKNVYKWTLYLNVISRKDKEGEIDMIFSITTVILPLFFSFDLLMQNKKAFLIVSRGRRLKANTLSLKQGFTGLV